MSKPMIIILIIMLLLTTAISIFYASRLETKSLKKHLDTESGLETKKESAIGAGISDFISFVRFMGIIIAVFNIICTVLSFMSGTSEKAELAKRKAIYVLLGLFIEIQAEILTNVVLSLFSIF